MYVQMAVETRRGRQFPWNWGYRRFPWNWGYRWLQAAVWVLGVLCKSSQHFLWLSHLRSASNSRERVLCFLHWSSGNGIQTFKPDGQCLFLLSLSLVPCQV